MKGKSTVYSVGDLVFAKVRGYPSWPAKVTSVLEGSKPPKYSVFFFGTYEVANIKGEDLTAYSEQTHQSMEKLNGKRKSYPEALHEIKNNPEMTPVAPPPPVSSKSSTPRQQTPAKSTESTPQSKKRKESSTPSSTVSAKRSKLVPDSQDSPSQEEVLSRSGRKIKVKRFADDQESLVSGGKSAGSSVSSPASSSAQSTKSRSSKGSLSKGGAARNSDKTGAARNADKCDADGEPEEPIVGDLPKEKARTNVPAECDELADTEEERKMIRLVEESAEITEDESGGGGKKLRVRAKCGVLLEVDISDPSRPKTFKSERARIMWDTATSINTRRLITRLSTGEYLPTHLHDQILARADLTDAQRSGVKLLAHRQRVVSQKMWHLLEVRLIDIDYRIKSNLLMNHQNHDGCLLALKDLLEITLAPLMLKKYPEIVDTVRKCRRYIHSAEIRQLADECYTKLKTLFVVPAGKTFRVYFDEIVSQFRLYTEDLTDSQLALLCRDPLFAKPGQSEVDSDDDLTEQDEDTSSPAKSSAALADNDQQDELHPSSEAKQDADKPKQDTDEATVGDGNADAAEEAPDESLRKDRGEEDADGTVDECDAEKDPSTADQADSDMEVNEADDVIKQSSVVDQSDEDTSKEVLPTNHKEPHVEKNEEKEKNSPIGKSDEVKETDSSFEKIDEDKEEEDRPAAK